MVGLIIVIVLAAVTAGGLAPLLAGVAKNLKSIALRIARAVEELPGKVRRVVTTVRLARSIAPGAVGSSLVRTVGKGKDAIRRAVQTARGAARPLFEVKWAGKAKNYLTEWWRRTGGDADKIRDALGIRDSKRVPASISVVVDPFDGRVFMAHSGKPFPQDPQIHPVLRESIEPLRLRALQRDAQRLDPQTCAEFNAINELLWASERRVAEGRGPRTLLSHHQVEMYTIRGRSEGPRGRKGDPFPRCKFCQEGAFRHVSTESG